MQAMIQRFDAVGCSSDELVRAGRRLANALDHVPGFVSCVIVRAQGGGLSTVTLFEEQAGLLAADGLTGTSLAEHLPGLIGPAEVTTGEVVFQRGM
jgi:hypothetical protein